MLYLRPFIRPIVLLVIISNILLFVSMHYRELKLTFEQEDIFPGQHPEQQEQLALEKGIDLGHKAQFIQAVLDNEIDGDFDPTAMREVCASKKWNDQLIFVCGAPQGGLGNIRNVFLTCVRYAIEAGGWCFPSLRNMHFGGAS
jgi:hypothetical protein